MIYFTFWLFCFLFSCFITDRKEVSFWAYWKEVSFLLLCFVPGGLVIIALWTRDTVFVFVDFSGWGRMI